jgi:hypothetical protein
MLSDSIRLMRQRLEAEGGQPELVLPLRAYEIEAKNMEERLQIASARPHVALDGLLVSAPGISAEPQEGSQHAG